MTVNDMNQSTYHSPNSAVILDGNKLAQLIETELGTQVDAFKRSYNRAPKLAVVLVGENPASKIYVKRKGKRAQACGIDVLDLTLPANISEQELHKRLIELGHNSAVDAILLQLPLPAGLDEFAAIATIPPEKDADGLHPLNQGRLAQGVWAPRPCTPSGCMELIDYANKQLNRPQQLSGLNAVVVGRSVLVGKPLGLMLLERHCTVTYCHSRTKDLPETTKNADILVAAVGKPDVIRAEHVKPGGIVIDVGINRLSSGEIVGDVRFAEAVEKAAAITPVPGGVGPMTIAMLLKNTVDLARAAEQRKAK